MKVYSYDEKKADNNHFQFLSNHSIFFVLLLIFVCSFIVIGGFLLANLTGHFVFLLSFPASIFVIIFYSANVIRYKKARQKIFTIDEETKNVYLIIDNRTSKEIPKCKELELSELEKTYIPWMSNERVLKWIIENPKNKACDGIEIYKILSVNNFLPKNSNETTIVFDGFELSNDLLYKNREALLVNIYHENEELLERLENHKNDYDINNLPINYKKQKKNNDLFSQNYRILKVSFSLFVITLSFGVLPFVIDRLNGSLNRIGLFLLVFAVIFFCITMAYYEPVNNTNICGKEGPKKFLIAAITLFLAVFFGMLVIPFFHV